MHDLTKGTYWSLMVHGTMITACLLVSYRMSLPAKASQSIGLALGTGSGGSRAGAKGGGPSGPRDLSDLNRKPAAGAAPGAAAPPPTAVTKASAARTKASSAGQTSPTGPAVLPAKADTKKETMAERIERIRHSARPLPSVPASRQARPTQPVKKQSSKDIAARLNAGLESADADSSGTGGGGGRGVNPRGRGSGTQDGAIDVGGGGGRGGSGNGSGDGDGDGDGGGGGGGQDPFLAAVSAALHEAWETPSRAEIGSGDRAVAVKITLRSDGRVTAFQVTRSSGNTALDQSVEQMLRQLRRLPAPAQYGSTEAVRTIEIMFRAV